MDGLHEMTAAAVPMTIAGRTWFLSPLRLRDYAEMERIVLKDRPRPLEIVKDVLAGLPDGDRRQLLELAYHDERLGRRIPRDELLRWADTVEGEVCCFWLRIRQKHPEVTLEMAEELLAALGDEEARQVDDAIRDGAETPLGNSLGRDPPTDASLIWPTTMPAAPSPGEPSIVN